MNFKFETISDVNNPNSVHGIYPYRGKISAKDAEQLIGQLPSSFIVLDPFCGSGTIVYEAQKRGLTAFGVDLNPLAVNIAKGKINMSASVEDELNIANRIIGKAKKLEPIEMPEESSKHFHKETAIEIMKIANFLDDMSDYTKACFYGAIALTARGCNWYKWTSSTVGKDIQPKQYINFFEKFAYKVKKHHHPTKSITSKVYLHDSRKISEIIPKESIDCVFTSPPYFDCLDYTAYYAKIIFPIIGIERSKVRKELIQTFSEYKSDMKMALDELYKVCKKGASIIFVVGDKKIKGELINGAKFFQDISPFDKAEILTRKYTNTSSQVFDKLNKTEREEQVIVWTK